VLCFGGAFEQFKYFESVDIGHLQVEGDQAGLRVLGIFHRLIAVRDDLGRITHLRTEVRDQFRDAGVIVDDQYFLCERLFHSVASVRTHHGDTHPTPRVSPYK